MLQQLLLKFKSRCNRAVYLTEFVNLVIPFLFVFGTTILLIRYFVPELFPAANGLLAFLLLLASIAYRRSKELFFNEMEARIWLEKKIGGEGYLFVAQESSLEQWSDISRKRIEEQLEGSCVTPPRLRLRQWALPLVPAIAFVLLACLVTVEPHKNKVENPLRNNTLLKEIQHKFELLQEEGVIDKEEMEDLQEEFDKLLQDEQENGFSSSYWEGLDTFSEKLDAEAVEAAAALSQSLAALQSASAIAKGDLTEAKRLEAKELIEQAMLKLSESGVLSKAPSDLLSKLGIDAGDLSKFSGTLADLDGLDGALDDLADFVEQNWEQLHKSGL